MSTAAKVGAFFLVVLVLAGLLIWKIEDLRIGREAGKTISVQFDGRRRPEGEVRRAHGGRSRRQGREDPPRRRQGDRRRRARHGTSRCATAPRPRSRASGMLGDKYIELVPGPVGAPPLAEGTTLQGDAPVSFDQITKLARDIEVDIREITSNLKSSLGGALGEERLTGIVENVLVLSAGAAQAARVQPRQHRLDDGELQRVLDADDPARRPHRQARRVQLRQRDATRCPTRRSSPRSSRRRSTT